jgi:hypothetical protein
MNMELFTVLALGIGLSASCGFRVFVPMLVASIAAHYEVFPVQESFKWLGSWPAMVAFGTATVFEILAYYIPYVDNVLDSIATPMAIGAGTLLMTSILPGDERMLKWMVGFIVGGGAAATIQGMSVFTRFFSTKFTAGAGNSVVATGENVAATGTSLLALIFPLIVAVLLMITVIMVLVFFRKKLFKQNPTKHRTS